MGAMVPFMLKLMVVLGLAVGVTASAYGKDKGVTVNLKDREGKDVGTIAIKPARSGVALKLNLHGLPPGEHALHFHQHAKCEAPGFESAGPHFNPGDKKHGLQNPYGAHAGDMPNITVDEKGRVKTTILNQAVSLGDDANSLRSNGGTSVIVHAKPDDMKTDPAGNAGERMACGVIR